MRPRSTELLLASSGLTMVALGLLATFAPVEIATFLGVGGGAAAVAFQLLGACLLGLGLANWSARKSLLGGIYGRPLALANTLHFLVGGLALAKPAIGGQLAPPLLALAGVYALFAVGFLVVLFGPSPVDS